MPKSSEPDTQGVHMWPIAIFAAVFIGCVALIVRSLDSGFLAKDRPADHRSGDRSAKYTPAISHVYQVNNTPNLATSNYAPPPPAPTIHVESVPPLPGPARETIPFVATQGEILTEKAPLADKPVDTGWRTSVMAEAPVTAYDDVPPLFPQSESTGTEWYFRGNDQVQTGPIREADFKRKIASGDIGNETFVWTKAFGREWKRLSEVHGLFDDNLPPPLPVRRPEVSGFAAWCVALFPIIHATIIAALHFHGGISDPFGNALATSAVYYAGILVFIGWDMALMKSAGYTQITSKFAIGILMFTLVLAPVTPAFYLSYRTSFTGETNTKNIVAVIMLAIYVLLYVVSLILNV